MTMRLRLLAYAIGAATLGVSLATPASAREREHTVGLDAGLSMLKIDDKSTLSVCCGLGAHYSYGINDQFDFLAEGAYSIVSLKEDLVDADGKAYPTTRPTTVGHAAVGIGYVLDVLTYVPYFGVLVGGWTMGGGTLESRLFLPGAELALGLDYKLNRQWSVGIAIRQAMMLVKTSTYPSYTNGFLRVQYSWGW
jgi:hypothetical protein